MSNLNNYVFANRLEQFKAKVLEPHKKKVDEAETIMNNPNYEWRDEAQKKTGQVRFEQLQAFLKFYDDFYNEGVKLCIQHENLTNKLSKLYDRWYNEVSNEGRQEKELMSMQADALNEIFAEIYSELKSLNLDIKPPSALNLK